MSNSTVATTIDLIPRTGLPRFWLNFKRHWQLHLMLLFPVIYIAIFSYGPLYGIQIIFKDYSPRAGIWGSEWVGLRQYAKFFGYYEWPKLVRNTVVIALWEIFVYFPCPIILALIMHVHQGKKLVKIVQNIGYVPHFISLVIMVGIINTIMNPVTGLVAYWNQLFGIQQYTDLRADPNAFVPLYTFTDIWQGVGYASIMYVSALTAVPDELHEAAKMDGASRLRRVFAIDLPTIMPTVAIMLILRFGGLLNVGYQKVYLMQNAMNEETSEIISTYVYKRGIRTGELSFGSAIGQMNAVINTALVFIVNKITNILTDNEMGLF